MISALYDRIVGARQAVDASSRMFIESAFDDAADTFQRGKQTLAVPILQAVALLVNCFRGKKKVLICGNGGSAAESQHLAAELVGRFEIARREGLPAISLTSDSAVMTAWANDFGYENIFSRQVEAYGEKGDVLFCFSTSGQSQNVINAMKAALAKGITCISVSGKGGGEMSLYADANLVVPSDSTQRVQELHLHILHTICGLLEEKLFGQKRQPINGNGKAHRLNGKYKLKVNG